MIKDHGSFSIGCVSFCRHRPRLSSHHEHQIHRLVRQAGLHQEASFEPCMRTNEVELPWGDAQLSDGITIDLQEIWNVEKEAKVAILGYMTDWGNVWHQINEIFTADSPSQPVVARNSADTTRPVALTQKDSTHRRTLDMVEDGSHTTTTVHNSSHHQASRHDGSGDHVPEAEDHTVAQTRVWGPQTPTVPLKAYREPRGLGLVLRTT